MEDNSQTKSLEFAQQYLPLSVPEKVYYLEMLKNHSLDNGLSAELLNYLIKVTDFRTLIKLAEHYPSVACLCEHKEMNEYWDGIMSKTGRRPTLPEAQADPKRKLIYYFLKPLRGMPSYHWVRGVVFYDKMIKYLKEKNLNVASNFLQKAADCKSFEAILAQSGFDYDLLQKERDLSSKQLDMMIKRIEAIITPYGTPAFLLLGSISLSISDYYAKNANHEAKKTSLLDALKYLHAAEISKRYSKIATDNVCNGKNIFCTKKFPKGIDVNKLSEFFAECIKELNVQKEDLTMIYFRGEETAKEYIQWAESYQSEDLEPHLEIRMPFS